MAQTTNEQLFEKMMAWNRVMRTRTEGPAPEFPGLHEGPHGPHGRGHCKGGPHGPEHEGRHCEGGHHGPHGRGHGRSCEGRPKPPLSREHILRALLDHEGGVRQKTLAGDIHVGAPTMSEYINRLEDDGYVTREVDPSDKRATLITLTEKGRQERLRFRMNMMNASAGSSQALPGREAPVDLSLDKLMAE